MQFNDVYRGRRVMITGHTGFKGSWLSLWLHQLGAELAGYSLEAPTTPNHLQLLSIPMHSVTGDVRDADQLNLAINEFQPEIVFHLAAQPLVRLSYRNPNETISTNIQGTLNVYEACRMTPSVRSIVSITSDKVYQNLETTDGYRETDRLGGADPYSCSKACVELISESYRKSFFESDDALLLATVRAGNVIGGGDWAEDRIVPDAVRAAADGKPLLLRNPEAVRPWQHVLDPLAGYLLVGEKLIHRERTAAAPWNFGPNQSDAVSVIQLAEAMRSCWQDVEPEICREEKAPHETRLLHLDSTQAKQSLNWNPVWPWDVAIQKTTNWYKNYYLNGNCDTNRDLDSYLEDASAANLTWLTA